MAEERRDESLQTTLRAQGYRLTPQRQLVLRAGHRAAPRHPGRDLPRGAATAGGVNISTVYRTLELLEELGLVTHTHLGHGAPTYHPATDTTTSTWSAGTAARSSRPTSRSPTSSSATCASSSASRPT